jgi:XTP/dITP diphosphohydrolase
VSAGGRVEVGGPILVATRNLHKLEELGEVLAGIELQSLPDDFTMPDETGETFAENALIKARAARRVSGGLAVLADDSGIEAAALGGRPGVRSARFAGPDADDESNLALLLSELEAHEDRSVAYVCVIALIAPDGEEIVREGRCAGWFAETPRGTGGFGYDPCFVPEDRHDGRTMAELSPAEKHAISHRGRAAGSIAAVLEGAR